METRNNEKKIKDQLIKQKIKEWGKIRKIKIKIKTKQKKKKKEKWNPTKGYKGQKRKIEKINKKVNEIDYGKIWDSTKGYEGEGPTETWPEILQNIENKLMETTTIGHNIWQKEKDNKGNLGKVISLNMQGWGASIERKLLWNQFTYMKAKIIVLIDHRRSQTQLKNIEAEAKINWIGEETK